ncbi:hypothetical protein C8A00DRAFT_45736 [Chaetomidium leptoderma]|uniref:Uncharacterized protein n=1 Tax=Chaetomidium leptoderma TaxID=669021 RepID=A0AAN6VH29_9PEZI|nr:hypothetical protein C8A00DRAFT_45736 [Chaetomidium leptoderma]
MSAVCTIAGTPNLYGLGIRVSFYLLWFFVLIGERCHERHAQVPRTVELILAYAVFLGLVMAASAGYLFAAEVYIALLLISTTVYLLVPRHTTDLAAWIRPDLGLGTRRGSFGFIGAARCLFVLIVISLHLWFWGAGVDSADIDRNLRGQGGCCPCQPPQQVGFAFGSLEMRSGGFRALNVLLMLALLTGGVIIGAMKAGLVRKKNPSRIRILREVETFGGLAVACILVAAIELTIKWNGISAVVNDVTTAAQLIPLGIIIALILVFLYDLNNGVSGGEGSSDSSGSNTRSNGTGGSRNGVSSSLGVGSSGPSSPSGGWSGTVRYPRPWPPPPSPAFTPVPAPPGPAPAPVSTPASVPDSDPPAPDPDPGGDPPPTHPDPAPPDSPPMEPAKPPPPPTHHYQCISQSKIATKGPKKHVTSVAQFSDDHEKNNSAPTISRRPTTLHKQATMRLSQTHADLSRQLTRALTHADTAFLAETEAQIKTLAQPLDRFRIRSQQRGGPDGAVRSEEHSVAELVARAEEQLRGFEDEVAGLWREEVVEREIAEAEEEVVELGDEAVGVMKEIEKDFRKATLPDLHTFFQSIDEP